VELRIHSELLEKLRVAKRFEDGPFQLRCEIHLTSRAVLKAQPHNVVSDVARFDNVIVHRPSLQRWNSA